MSIHGGITRHGLEHLASTDRGIIMLRNMIRRGIRAVQHGADPRHHSRQDGEVIPTYAHDRVVSGIPPALTSEEDRQLLQQTGRKVVEDCQRLAQTTYGLSHTSLHANYDIAARHP